MTASPQPTTPLPHRALVIEAGGPDRRVLAAVVAESGLRAVEVTQGSEALAAAEANDIDLIVLDMDLPDQDGLRLLTQLRADHPDVPIIIVADPEDAARVEAALDLGAVNFVCRPVKEREIRFILNRIQRALREEEGLQEAIDGIVKRSTSLEFSCDPFLIPSVVSLLGREAQCHYPGYRVPLADIKLALYEALANAIEHGSLEIDFDGKAEAMLDPGGLAELIQSRREDPRLSHRTVRVEVHYGPEAVEYRVGDDGKGFDPACYCPKRALSDVESLHGRGLALIRHYMDEVEWNADGNEIRMVRSLKRRRTREPDVSPSGSD